MLSTEPLSNLGNYRASNICLAGVSNPGGESQHLSFLVPHLECESVLLPQGNEWVNGQGVQRLIIGSDTVYIPCMRQAYDGVQWSNAILRHQEKQHRTWNADRTSRTAVQQSHESGSTVTSTTAQPLHRASQSAHSSPMDTRAAFSLPKYSSSETPVQQGSASVPSRGRELNMGIKSHDDYSMLSIAYRTSPKAPLGAILIIDNVGVSERSNVTGSHRYPTVWEITVAHASVSLMGALLSDMERSHWKHASHLAQVALSVREQQKFDDKPFNDPATVQQLVMSFEDVQSIKEEMDNMMQIPESRQWLLDIKVGFYSCTVSILFEIDVSFIEDSLRPRCLSSC